MTETWSKNSVRFGRWTLDVKLRQLSQDGVRTPLPPKSMDVLLFLLANRDRYVSADELLDTFWAGRVVEQSTIHRRINLIRTALGDNSRSPIYIDNQSKQGYRFIAEVESVATPSPSLEGRDEPAAGRRWVAGLAGVVVVLVLMVAWFNRTPAPKFSVESVAVLPLDDLSVSAELGWLTAGLARSLNERLRSIGTLYVPSELAIASAVASGSPPVEMAGRLGVTSLVSGHVREASGDAGYLVHIEVSDPKRQTVLWSRDFEARDEDLLALQDQVAGLVSGFIGLRAPDPARKHMPATPLAYASFLKYLYAEAQDHHPESLIWIDQTLRQEPEFAYGYIQAGWTYFEEYGRTLDASYRERAHEAYQQARSLGPENDPNWLNAWGGYLSRIEARHAEAETYLRRAATGGVLTQYIHLLLASGLFEAARDAALHVLASNPASKDERHYLNATYALMEEYDALLASARAGTALFPDNFGFSRYEVWALIRLGRLEEAEARIAELGRSNSVVRNNGALRSMQTHIAVLRGDKSAALQRAAELEAVSFTTSAGLMYLLAGDERGVPRVREALHPFYMGLPFYLAPQPAEVRNHPALLEGVRAYGYDPAWRAELCALAASMPTSSGIGCDPVDLENP